MAAAIYRSPSQRSMTTRVQWRGNKTWVLGRGKGGSDRPFTVTSVWEAHFQEGTVHLHPRTVFGNSRPHSKHGSSARRCSRVWGAITGELRAKAVCHRWTVAWGRGDCGNGQLHVRKYCVFFFACFVCFLILIGRLVCHLERARHFKIVLRWWLSRHSASLIWTMWLAPLNTASHEGAGIKVTVAECWQEGTQWKAAENRRLGLKRAEGGKKRKIIKLPRSSWRDWVSAKTSSPHIHWRCSFLLLANELGDCFAFVFVLFFFTVRVCPTHCHCVFFLKQNAFYKAAQNNNLDFFFSAGAIMKKLINVNSC